MFLSRFWYFGTHCGRMEKNLKRVAEEYLQLFSYLRSAPMCLKSGVFFLKVSFKVGNIIKKFWNFQWSLIHSTNLKLLGKGSNIFLDFETTNIFFGEMTFLSFYFFSVLSTTITSGTSTEDPLEDPQLLPFSWISSSSWK